MEKLTAKLGAALYVCWGLLHFTAAYGVYKLARVSAGLADITFTLTPKHEWDVAAGAALVLSGGGFVETLDSALVCNRKDPLISGLIAGGPLLKDELLEFLAPYAQAVVRK